VSTPSLAEALAGADVVICAGPGGVGKTTTAAAVAVHAAASGRRACVVTIDPAKRLADALGLEALGDEPHPVEGPWGEGGGLWALMLDTKSTFDTLVRRYAAGPQQAEAILSNPFYRNISGALSGTQEYMAVEKLYELHDEGRFDLVVVDTPPTRQALDFLDAPRRLMRFLDNRIFRVLMMPTRAGLRAVNVATQLLLRTISRVVGGEVVGQALAFFTAFEGMEQGFRDRTDRVEALLRAGTTRYVLVASPRAAATAEACYFAQRLAAAGMGVAAVVENRVFPDYGPPPPGIGTPKTAALPNSRSLSALLANAADLHRVATSEARHIRALAAATPGARLVRVPFLADEVHDLGGLSEVAAHLFPGS
jgi:anion-transporting  ArsA/GET3 family ATPase